MKISWMLFCAFVAAAVPATAQRSAAQRNGWIASWGTAQQLGPQVRPKFRPAPVPSAVRTTPTPSIVPPSPMVPYPERLSDQTVRMIVRTSVGGSRFRLEFSNAQGETTVSFSSVHAALAGEGAVLVGKTDRVVTFGGRRSVTMLPGARIVSDPVNLSVPALARVAVSIHVPGETPTNTVHPLGLLPAYIVAGDATGAERMDAASSVRSYFWLTGLDVPVAGQRTGTIVALGDSITDGYATSPGQSRAWLDLLAQRLQGRRSTAGFGVVNAGISGNRILRTGAGEAAIARFDEDVLARPGVRWIILLEGINDINMSIMPGMPAFQHATAGEIIAGLRQIVERAHLHGIQVAIGTILPTKGLPFYSSAGEDMRGQVNRWIRTGGVGDAVIDFDAAVRDPADLNRLRPDFDPGDHVHPNDSGNKAMADAIDLAIFD